MGSDQCVWRLDTLDIQTLIYQKIGHRRASSYLCLLGKYLSSRISKSEFDKLCIKTIGRENIPLHNRLLRSILKNASVAKSPPLRYLKKPENVIRSQSCRNSALPYSPRKCRSRNFRELSSPLGPLGKPQSITTTMNDESMSKAQRVPVEDGEEVEQMTGSLLTAPLGVSFNRKSGIRKSILGSSNGLNRDTCQSSGALPDTITLRARLERELEMKGIKLSMDSANLFNRGLDAYIKRLIEPCLSLASQRNRAVSNVSMLDFRTAMELNPQVLGKEWSINLEKASEQ